MGVKAALLLLISVPIDGVFAHPLGAQDAPQHRFTIVTDSVEVAFELQGPAVVALADSIRQTAAAALAYGIELFGSLPAQFLDGAHERITIAVVEGKELRGESAPSRIDITMRPPEAPLDRLLWRGVLTHEIFHLWNAEGFRYATVEEQWLSEGFTQYYTLRILGKTGVLDESTYLVFLGRLLGMYLSDPGLGSISIRDAGPVKQEHTGLVEGGGLGVALCLDVELRTASGGARSLDDVMRLLFSAHDAGYRRYDLGDVKRYVGEIRGEDRAAFFTDYVAGTALLPLAECLAPAGLILSLDQGIGRVTKTATATESQRRLLTVLRGG